MNAPETLDTNNTDQDTRTTPRWLRLPGLVLLAVLSGYFGVAAVSALDKDPVTIVRQNPYFFWFGTWKMFTTRERYHVSMEAEAFINGGWEPFELSELFPYRWESGERYARGVFRRHRVRMSTLGQATCGRYAAANQQDPDRSSRPGTTAALRR